MEENKFEKQVQQKMEELRLPPSGAVWKKIEEELQKKKKRRVLFLLFSIAGLCLLGYSGYILSDRPARPTAIMTDHDPTSPTIQPAGRGSAAGDRSLPQDIRSTGSEKEGKSITPREISLPAEQLKPTGTLLLPPGEETEWKNRHPANLPASIAERTMTKNGRSGKIKGPSLAGSSAGDARGLEGKADQGLTVTIQEKDPGGSFPGEPVTAVGIADMKAGVQAATGVKDSSLASIEMKKDEPSIMKKGRKKLRWIIDGSLGISDQWTKGSSQKSVGPTYSQSPSNIGNSISASLNPPSPAKAGPAFRLGILAEWKIAERHRLLTGLQYVYMTNSIKVGNYSTTFNNTANSISRSNAVYRGVPQNTYHNRYHYLQVPLLYQFQLNRSKKLPLVWENGISVSYLLSTNGLLYDSGLGGSYYHDQDAFNRMSLNLHTGLALRFGNSNKWSWSIGPEFSLGTGRVAKEGYDKNHRQLYGGITGRVILK